MVVELLGNFLQQLLGTHIADQTLSWVAPLLEHFAHVEGGYSRDRSAVEPRLKLGGEPFDHCVRRCALLLFNQVIHQPSDRAVREARKEVLGLAVASAPLGAFLVRPLGRRRSSDGRVGPPVVVLTVEGKQRDALLPLVGLLKRLYRILGRLRYLGQN